MASRKNVIDENGEVPDLSRLDAADLKPFETLPASLQSKLRGRPKAPASKERPRS